MDPEPAKLASLDYQPDPRINDGERMLLAMKKMGATDLRVSNLAVPSFKVAGSWQKGSKEFTEDSIRRCLAGLLTESEFQNLLSGIDIKKSYVFAGVGNFFLSAYLRDGKPAWTAVNA